MPVNRMELGSPVCEIYKDPVTFWDSNFWAWIGAIVGERVNFYSRDNFMN